MKTLIINYKSWPFFIAVLHFVLVLLLFLNMLLATKGYGSWYLLFVIDFPISILFQWIIRVLKYIFSTTILHEFPSSKLPLLTIIQFLMFSILGSAWYYMLTLMIQKLWAFLFKYNS